MSADSEYNFKQTLKTLVFEQPEKLAFYSGLEPQMEIPMFVPSNEYAKKAAFEQAHHLEQKQIKEAQTQYWVIKKRRSYSFGMAAAAACLVLFMSISLVGLRPGDGTDNTAPKSAGLGTINVGEAAPAPDISEYGNESYKSTGTEDENESAKSQAGNNVPAQEPVKDQENTKTQAGASIQTDAGGSSAGTETTPFTLFGIPAYLALICAAVFAALFVVLTVKRRKIQ